MKIKTNELTGAALDWAVAKSAKLTIIQIKGGFPYVPKYPTIGGQRFSPSTDWSQAGPIIEREAISTIRCDDAWGEDDKGYSNNTRIPVWAAEQGRNSVQESTEHQQHDPMYQIYVSGVMYGPTPLVAAMRCNVALKMGDEVEIPQELK
jgi:hypothetical protein